MSVPCALAKKMMGMPLPGTIGAPVIAADDVTKSIEAYESLSSCPRTDPVAGDLIATFLYYCLVELHEMIKMMNGNLRKDWKWLKDELEDGIRHANSRVYMYTRLY